MLVFTDFFQGFIVDCDSRSSLFLCLFTLGDIVLSCLTPFWICISSVSFLNDVSDLNGDSMVFYCLEYYFMFYKIKSFPLINECHVEENKVFVCLF